MRPLGLRGNPPPPTWKLISLDAGPTPAMPAEAWQRLQHGPRRYAITGITRAEMKHDKAKLYELGGVFTGLVHKWNPKK